MPEDPSQEEQHLGRRTLAAIMFTDVVGFSRRAGENEDLTLRLTARDLRIIGGFVKQHEGRVIKSTGDGCLAFFPSGVQAVACAQEIQHHFAELAQTLSAEELLQHRIGIHLGDVYVKGNEVMGDGVNIAARLQTEAPPGGICISQALYEIAKSRLRLQTVHLGPKQLKNIRESVQVYQVLINAEEGEADSPAPPTKDAAPFLKKHWLLGAAALVVVAALAAVLVNALNEDNPTPEETAQDPSSMTSQEDVAPPVEQPRAQALDAMAAAALAEYPKMNDIHLKTRDYAALADWIERSRLHKQGAPLHDDFVTYRKLAGCFAWAGNALGDYRQSAPLVVNSPIAGRMTLWSDPNGKLLLKTETGTAQQTSLRRSPEAAYVLLVLTSLARDQWKDTPPATAGEDRRVMDGIRLFAKQSNLSAEKLLSWLKEGSARGELSETKEGPAAMMKQLDANRDGALTRDELPERAATRLMRMDRDNDGKLTLQELKNGRLRQRRPLRRP